MGGHPSGWSLNYKKRIMAISVDTVYQRVLALANKEQRGYITPQEFNLLANQAQIGIFEGYFFAKNKRQRLEDKRSSEVDETDLEELIARKLAPFQSIEVVNNGDTFPMTVTAGNENTDVFQTGKVFYNNQVCQKISINEANRYGRSVRHASTTTGQGPIYTDNLLTGRDILVYSGPTVTLGVVTIEPITSMVSVECFRVPIQANWGYVVVNEKALYNANVSVDFELHKSEEDTLVYEILELAGITIGKPGLMQAAQAIEQQEIGMQNT